MGRPRKDEYTKKLYMITVRLTKEQFAYANAHANADERSSADWLRGLLVAHMKRRAARLARAGGVGRTSAPVNGTHICEGYGEEVTHD